MTHILEILSSEKRTERKKSARRFLEAGRRENIRVEMLDSGLEGMWNGKV